MRGDNDTLDDRAVRLDVTKQEDIDAALATIKKAGRGLYGLINNTGVGTAGSAIESPQEEFDLAMQVNAHGPWRVTKAFAPFAAGEATVGSSLYGCGTAACYSRGVTKRPPRRITVSTGTNARGLPATHGTHRQHDRRLATGLR